MPNTISSNGLSSFEGELPERDELLDFIGNVAVPLHWVGEDGTILWANTAELDFLGYSREEYVGKSIKDFHVDQAVIGDILDRLLKDEELHRYQAQLRCKDGSVRDVAISSSVYRKDGRFIHTRCVSVDVTKDKLVSELQGRLAAIVESSVDAVLSKDLNGIIQSWNRGAQNMFGYTADEAIGQHISLLAAPETRDEFPNILDKIRRGERVEHYETKRRAKDGKILTISLSVSPIRDASGTVIGASKVARDIGDLRQFAQLQERLAAIVESSDDAILSKDLNGTIQSWNSGAQRLFGYTPDEIIGKHISTLAAPGYVDEIPNILDRIKRGERIHHYQTKRLAKDGRILTISLTVSPVRDGTGKIVGASKVARDVTERYEQEMALQRANTALLRANEDLQQFAYSASHDLQEPLRMVSIYSAMLRKKFKGQLGEVGDGYIEYTLQGAIRMQQLLQDLRTYTQASIAGEEPQIDLDASTVFQKAMQSLESSIKESGSVITHSELPAIRLHEFQLEQLFQNLIGNAIRYRSQKAVKIHVAAQRRDAEWLFSVADNGIGIEPQYQEQIFGIFKRLHSAAEYPGTGMGLAICQRIIERAGGRIWVESEEGHGSTFFFTIPDR